MSWQEIAWQEQTVDAYIPELNFTGYLVDTSGSSVTLILPLASRVPGYIFFVHITAVGGGAFVLSAASALDGTILEFGDDTLNGLTGRVSSEAKASIIVSSTGSDWVIISEIGTWTDPG